MCAVDISAPCIDKARRAQPENEYLHYDGYQLPYADHSFELAWTICVMHHVPPQHWQNFANEMIRVLKPGGIACVIEHNPLNPLTRLAVFRCPFDEDAVLLSRWKTEKLLAQAGCNQIQTNYFLLLPSKHNAAQMVEKSLQRLPLGAQYVTIGKK